MWQWTSPLLCALAWLSAGCSPPGVRPVSYPDPEVPCPGGRITWGLDVIDRRADREGEAQTVAAIRDSIRKSFPGCRWEANGGAGGNIITIEIHRFASRLEQGSWEAAAEWSVGVRDSGGRILTEFEANEEVSRPNYQGSNNERESLSQAFERALDRTVKGLGALPNVGAIHPREETSSAGAALCAAVPAREPEPSSHSPQPEVS